MKTLLFFVFFLEIFACSSLVSVFSLINAGAAPFSQENLVAKALISLGKSHKNRYSPLFSPEYNHSRLQISSSAESFCVKAAYFYAKGLYNQRKTALLPENFPKERAWPPYETSKETTGFRTYLENREILPVHSGFPAICAKNSNISKEMWENTRIFAKTLLFSLNISEKFDNYTDLLRVCGEILEKSTDQAEKLGKLVVFKEMLLLLEGRGDFLRVLKQLQGNLQGNSKEFSVFVGEQAEICALISWLNASNAECLRDFLEKNGESQGKCVGNFSKIASFVAFETYATENREKTVRILVNDEVFQEFSLEVLEKLVENEVKFHEEANKSCDFAENRGKSNRNEGSFVVGNKKLQEQEREIEKNYKFITALIIIQGFLLVVVSGLIYFRKRNRI